MQDLPALLGIAMTIALGAASPGPSFVMLVRTAVSTGRQCGLAAAAGIGLGGFIFALLAMFGLHGLLLAQPSFYALFRLLGGVYLAWLGSRIWRSASQPLAAEHASATGKSTRIRGAFLSGLTTQLSNPKTAVVYASVFAAFLPEHPTLQLTASIAISVLLIETSWYAAVALTLSSSIMRQRYLSWKTIIDRCAGAVMFLLGLKLAVF